MKSSIRVLPALFLVGLAVAVPAGAGNMTLNDAVTHVRGREDGRVLRAETQRSDASEEHRVRILTNEGRVRQYRIDARTGAVLPPGPPGSRR
ncbi:MAG: PepSY domain-containing protein [Gammaproteobacteria bacterium]|nr:PepSY domain-containing protein [Gammaproteobacteria bacterium]MBU1653511.1 PepSY domain-containing protein [Gammaproteobacteria bacterium]MBU1961859.1 PepSY domain-containing protein [Gammaproteobacteria bacterium]